MQNVRKISTLGNRRYLLYSAVQKANVGAEGVKVIGRCFANIAYAQLVAEHGSTLPDAPTTVAIIFQRLIEDLSKEALTLTALFPPRSPLRAALRRVARVAKTAPADLEAAIQLVATQYGTT